MDTGVAKGRGPGPERLYYGELILANQIAVLPNRASCKTFVIAEVGHRVVGSIPVHLGNDHLIL